MVWEMNEAMINLIAMIFTAITAIGVVVGVWIAWHELRQTRKNTILQLIDSTASYLRTDEALDALKSIYYLSPKQAESLKDLDLQQRRVLETIEMLGEMVNEKLVDPKPVVRIWAGVLALRCWYKLHDYIKRERAKRGTIYCENLEDLASRAMAYAQKERRNQVWIRLYVEDGADGSGEDIIDKMDKTDELRPKTIKEKRRIKIA